MVQTKQRVCYHKQESCSPTSTPMDEVWQQEVGAYEVELGFTFGL